MTVFNVQMSGKSGSFVRNSLQICAICLGLLTAGHAVADSQPLLSVNASGNYLSGLHAAQSHDYETSAHFLDAALELAPENNQLALQAFISHWRSGNYQRAGELAKQIASRDANNLRGIVSLQLAVDALRDGKYEVAEAMMDRARRNDHASIRILPMVRAWTLALKGEKDNALETLRGIRSVQKLILNIQEGKMQEFFGDLDAAEKAYFGDAKDINTLPTPTFRAVIRIMLQKGDVDGARNALADYMNVLPGNTDLEKDMSGLMRDKKLAPLSEGALPALADGTFHMSQFVARQSWELGLDFMRLAVHMDDSLDLGRLDIADLLRRKARFKEADKIFKQISSKSPYHWEARRMAANNLYNLGEKEKALEALEEMSVERPGHVETLADIGQIYRRDSQFPEMEKTLTRLIDRLKGDRQSHWLYYYNRGIARHQLDKWDLAEADFLHALKLSPEQPEVLNYLGYSWVELNLNLDQALEMLNRAVARHPAGYIIDSLGWAHYHLGNYETAVKHLERAVEMDPLQPEINDHLGDAYWKAGRKREARYQWERVLGLEATEEVDQDEVAAKLESGLPEKE